MKPVLGVQSSTSLSWLWAAVEAEAGPLRSSSSPCPGCVRLVHTPLVCDPGREPPGAGSDQAHCSDEAPKV